MRSTDNLWTEARAETLRHLWNNTDLTALQISARLGYVTRSAVIGKAHRMGLPRRKDTDPKATRKGGIRAAMAQREKRGPVNHPVSRTTRAVVTIAALPLPTEEPAPPMLKTLLEIEDGECRWFYGDPKRTKRGFCGCKSSPGTSWCAKHMISRPGSPGVYTMPSPERIKMVAEVEAQVMEPAE